MNVPCPKLSQSVVYAVSLNPEGYIRVGCKTLAKKLPLEVVRRKPDKIFEVHLSSRSEEIQTPPCMSDGRSTGECKALSSGFRNEYTSLFPFRDTYGASYHTHWCGRLRTTLDSDLVALPIG